MSLSVISPLVHRKVLRGETRIWLLNDILLPFAGPLLLLPLALRFAPPENATRLYALLFLADFMGFGYVTMLFTCRSLREGAFSMLASQIGRASGRESVCQYV